MTIGLQDHVAKHFNNILLGEGYRCVKSGPYLVRFESSRIAVELVFDGRRSYEIGLLVGEVQSIDPLFTIDEILRCRKVSEANLFSLMQATTSEELEEWIEKLARVLVAYGWDLIEGRREGFAAMAECRLREVREYAIERELRFARDEAEKAWRDKDYDSVVRFLKPFQSVLTRSEVSKLEFAEKHRGDW